jgi:calpain-7
LSFKDVQTFSSKASKAEFARNYDQAFRFYIKTAEAYIHLSRSSIASDKSKQQWKTNASRALERAEKIKRFVEVRAPSGSANNDGEPSTPELNLTPVGINHFAPRTFTVKILSEFY